MFGHIEMDDLTSAVFDQEKAAQHAKGQSGHGEEVHGREDVAVIVQKSSPELSGMSGRRQRPDIAGHGTLGEDEAEFEEFTVNSGATPGGSLLGPTPNENAKLGMDLGPAPPLGARSKAPEQSKTSPMPSDHGLGFDDDQDVVPGRPEPAERYPKQPILDAQPRARILSLQYAELLAKGQDLEAEAVTGTEEGAEGGEETQEKWNHGLGFMAYESVPAPALIR